MKLGRTLLVLGAVLLFATAAFHASGGAMVSGWLQGDRQAILRLLWYVPVVDWSVVALLWLLAAWRGGGAAFALVAICATVPLAAAAMLIAAVGPGFPGIWMLIGSAVLALAGGVLLRSAHRPA